MISDKPTERRTQEQHCLPFGISDLDSRVVADGQRPQRVRCYIKDCPQMLRTPTRSCRGEVCPEHGIRCHYSSAGATYSYTDPTRNIIASPQIFGRYVIGNPFKYESHRLGLEKSEDSLSWNVWRSLQEAGCLHQVAALITGERVPVEPFLYLWGICTTDDQFRPWDLLIDARNRFENALPVDRPLTEPDISLHLPGKYLIHIEAKFTSHNTYYEHGPRQNSKSLTLKELVAIYQFDGMRLLDMDRAARSSRIYYQLWRNMVFAEWMARHDHPNTRPFHVNLVREGEDESSAGDFRQLLTAEHRQHFRRMTWEQIHGWCHQQPGLDRLQQYLQSKTAALKPAFRLPR